MKTVTVLLDCNHTAKRKLLDGEISIRRGKEIFCAKCGKVRRVVSFS